MAGRTHAKFLHIPMTKARVNLGAVVRAVATEGEIVVLEKDGIPLAAILDLDKLEDLLDLQDPELKAQLRRSAADARAGRGRPIEDLIAELESEAK